MAGKWAEWARQTVWALSRCGPHCTDFLCLPVCPDTQSPQLLTFFCLFLLLLTCLEWRGDSGSSAVLSFIWAPKTKATEMRRLVLRHKLPDSEQNFPKVLPPPSQGQFLGTWRIPSLQQLVVSLDGHLESWRQRILSQFRGTRSTPADTGLCGMLLLSAFRQMLVFPSSVHP